MIRQSDTNDWVAKPSCQGLTDFVLGCWILVFGEEEIRRNFQDLQLHHSFNMFSHMSALELIAHHVSKHDIMIYIYQSINLATNIYIYAIYNLIYLDFIYPKSLLEMPRLRSFVQLPSLAFCSGPSGSLYPNHPV